jgi:hypothetical protein
MKKPSRFEKLGFGHALRLSWLDFALRLALQQCDPKEAQEQARKFVASENTVDGVRGESQLKKGLSLLASWYKPNKDLVLFRNQLLLIAKDVSVEQWPILHWAILSAHYPFLYQVTLVLGRLFSLQGQANKSQIEKRIEEVYGTMPFVERNMRFAIVTLANLGFLKMNGTTGLYMPPEELRTINFELTAILWKALLHATKEGCLSTTTLRNSPVFYPFSLSSVFLGKFVETFEDVDYRSFVGSDEQVYLKNMFK